MPFLTFSKSTNTSKQFNRPSSSTSATSYAEAPQSSTHSSQSHSRTARPEQPQSYIQPKDRSHTDYPPSSHGATSSRGPHESYHQRLDVSPVREASRSHDSGSRYGDRPVSPLGTSRFEQSSPWSNRHVPSRRPQTSAMRDEHGFSIRTPHSQRLQGDTYGMSAYAPLSTDEYEHFEPRGRQRGYSEASVDQSGRGDAYGASRASGQAYNMQSDFRNGGFSDWMDY